MDSFTNQQKAVWGIISLLVISQALLLYTLYSPKNSTTAGKAPGSLVAAEPPPPEEVGVAPAGNLQIVRGKVGSVAGSDITLLTPAGTSIVIRTSASTKLVGTDGSPKDTDVQQADTEAYNKKVTELNKDPVKNKAQIEAMYPPNPFVEKNISLTDLKAGDSMVAYALGKNSDGSYGADQVVILYSPGAVPK